MDKLGKVYAIALIMFSTKNRLQNCESSVIKTVYWEF